MIEAAGSSRACTMVYDNLVVDFGSPAQSAVDKSNQSLHHFTTSTYINHCYDVEDLRCADEVRKTDPYNDQDGDSKEYGFDLTDLLEIPSVIDDHGLTGHQRFFAWALRKTLCEHGPAFFRTFRKELGAPDVVRQIPVCKTEQIPVKAMKLDNSTVSGNIDAMEGIQQQGGLKKKDPEHPTLLTDVPEYVQLVCGDLGTAERIESGKRRRAMDLFPSNTLSDMIFIPGMFHVKMALVDMLWRLFIKPFSDISESTSAISATKYLCPRTKDTNKLLKGPPTYQQMKRFLNHLGRAEQLCCWKTALIDRFGPTAWTDFDNKRLFSKLSEQINWDDILELSYTLVRTWFDFAEVEKRRKNTSIESRDKQLENTMLRNTYILLYEETIYAMNYGDEGRLERCLIDWIPAFRAVRKHKYAFHLMKFYVKVNHVYPDKLK